MKRRAAIFQHGKLAAYLEENDSSSWSIRYESGYAGPPISLTMPVAEGEFTFENFPPVLDGLLPEGPQLESLLRLHKIDRHNHFAQLVTVGQDLVGSLTVESCT